MNNAPSLHHDALILETLKARPQGMPTDQILVLVGKCKKATSLNLRRLLDAGLIQSARQPGGGAQGLLYFATEYADTINAVLDAERARREQERKDKAKQRWQTHNAKRAINQMPKREAWEAFLAARRAEKEARDAASEAELDAPFVRRIVPAHLAKPLVKRGPASVWELAA